MRIRKVRLPRRDRLWAGTTVTRVLWGLDLPAPDEVRARIADAQRTHPGSRFGCRVDGAGRLYPVPAECREEFLASVVATSPEESPGVVTSPGEPPGGATPSGELPGERSAAEAGAPFTVTMGPSWVVLAYPHMVFDGRTALEFLAGLLGPDPDRLSRLIGRRECVLPVFQAGVNTYLRHPGAVLRLAREPRPRPVTAPDGTTAPGAGSAPGAGAATREYSAPVPGAPRAPACLYRVSHPDLLPELRSWRDRHVPGASVASILFSRFATAFGEAFGASGHPARDGVVVLFDARRYLPSGRHVTGNFSSAVYVRPRDLRDPVAMGEVLRSVAASGRPLAAMALACLTPTAPSAPTAPTGPGATVGPPSPLLAFSHVGRADALAGLPWSGGPEDMRIAVSATPPGAEGLTVNLLEGGGRLHVSASFHDAVFPPAVVAGAIAAVLGEESRIPTPPVSLPGELPVLDPFVPRSAP